jgi:hypothetical protein
MHERLMRILNGKSRGVLVFLAASLALIAPSAVGQNSTNHPSQVEDAQKQYLALSLGNVPEKGSSEKTVNRYGVTFLDGVLPLHPGGSAEVSVGGRASRIFLLGMTDANVPTTTAAEQQDFSLHPGAGGGRNYPPYGWADPLDSSFRFFVGEELGRIRLNYADGTTQVFPIRLGEGVWWGRAFNDFQEPFTTDARLRQTFAAALRLYPPAPAKDGNYIAVMVPKPGLIRSIVVENSPAKKGTLVIRGITVESADTNNIPGAAAVSPGVFTPEFEEFAKMKALRPLGEDEQQTQTRLNDLRRALYTSDEEFSGHVAASAPSGYRGPEVSFRGNTFAEILANAFRYNVQDIANKIDQDGMYHTSTKDAISWGGYKGFGTFRNGVGAYYGVSYTRDMGRSLQEITTLGYTDLAARNADYSLRMARSWTTDPALKFKGVSLPPHWGDLVNRPRNPSFENDGQGLTILFLYKLWQRQPDRNAWLRTQWPDIKAAGDWILWQFAHPEISGARNGLLHTTGESANGDGYSVYPDTVCMLALKDLARMADSIGETSSAKQWRDRSDQMREAITSHYIVSDAKYGPVWTLDYANWTHKGSVLGPLILPADDQGFAPEDSNPQWRAVNEATYQRLIDTYSPFGFYGQSMGYGQGFVAQSALLLDRMRDATQMLDWAAKEIYDPRFGSFVVPEGVQIDPTGRFWYRIGDLGNGVQEGEIVKTLRIVMGVDDTQPDRLQFFPRMPYDWKEIAVKKYPIVFESSGELRTGFLSYTLKRSGDAMDLSISSDKDLGPVAMRLGPFAKRPEAHRVRVNGKIPSGTSVEQSGDSWWIRFAFPVRQVPNTNK